MLRQLIKDLRLAPLRSALTGLSMLIGIVAVILAVLAGTIGKDYLVAINEQLYGRTPLVTVSMNSPRLSDADDFSRLADAIAAKNHETAIILNLDTDITFSPGTQSSGGIKGDVVATTPGYSSIYNLPMKSGRWYAGGERSTASIVVNLAAEQNLPKDSTAYAKTNQTTIATPFTVTGVVNDGRTDPTIYVNAQALTQYMRIVSRSATILWLDFPQLGKQRVRTVVEDILFDSIGGSVSGVQTIDNAQSYESVITVMQIAFGVCAILLLFVSAIGIVNIGLASLESRTHELLVRRALGATRASLIGLVIGSQLIIGLSVSLLAVAISACAVGALPAFLPSYSPLQPPGRRHRSRLGGAGDLDHREPRPRHTRGQAPTGTGTAVAQTPHTSPTRRCNQDEIHPHKRRQESAGDGMRRHPRPEPRQLHQRRRLERGRLQENRRLRRDQQGIPGIHRQTLLAPGLHPA